MTRSPVAFPVSATGLLCCLGPYAVRGLLCRRLIRHTPGRIDHADETILTLLPTGAARGLPLGSCGGRADQDPYGGL